MATLRYIGLVLVLAVAPLWAQRQMSVEQLEQFVRSSITQKHKDGEVADILKNVRLTERLGPNVVENLQGLGAGQRTMAALRALVTSSAQLAVPGPAAPVAPAAPPIPAPSAADQKRVLAEITRLALDYTKSLPNFICTQVTRRYVAPASTGGFQPMDVIQEQLSFVDGKETYKVVLVNNQITNRGHDQLGGATSSGEFGSRLFEIFRPESKTSFEWFRWGQIRGRRMHVIAFRVEQRNSEFGVYDEESGRHITAGYHGDVYADADSKAVMRISMTLDGLEDFPIRHVDQVLDYDFQEISGQRYVLPLRAELNSTAPRYLSRNNVEFRLYSRFSADAKIIFDTPDELPKDQTEEGPVK